MWVYVYRLVPMEVRRGHPVPWNWSYREQWAFQWGYWEPNSSSLSASNCRDTSPVPGFCIFFKSPGICVWFSVHAKKDFYSENLEIPLSLAFLVTQTTEKAILWLVANHHSLAEKSSMPFGRITSSFMFFSRSKSGKSYVPSVESLYFSWLSQVRRDQDN